ncbi:MAG: hypothetical protein WD267_08505 [Balneolales bacterium]
MNEVVNTRITKKTHALAKKIAKDQGIKLIEVLELAVKEMRKELFYNEFNKSSQRLQDAQEKARIEEEQNLAEKLNRLGIK